MIEEPVEFEEVKPSPIKKIVTIFLGIFLIVLFLTFLLTDSQLRSNIKGLFESSKIKDEIITSGDITIIFNNELYKELLDIRKENIDVEFKLCLFADYSNKTYTVKELYKPITYTQEYNKVVSEPCPKETLIDLHSHPYKHCSFSEQDVISFNKFKELSKDAIMMVMCEENRFNIYPFE
ncbi:MAG: hypothetical protein PHT54_03135 [Candidatus Nanoarchaeia archaeon]|nr:hypothetical protein [Candidatus Nanoarchaeia archaeon]